MHLPPFLTDAVDDEVCFVGRRINLYTVLRRHKEGTPAEQIAADLELSLDLVQQALAFAETNRDEVEACYTAYRAELERMEAEHVPPADTERLGRLAKRCRELEREHADDPVWKAMSIGEKVRFLLDNARTAEGP
jgi:uncharacterized protein (DUF433 family)